MAYFLSLPSRRLIACSLILLGGSLLTGAAAFAPGQTAPSATPAPPAANSHPEFPPGPGRDVTLTKCSGCHSANNILAQGRSREGWEDIITKMVGFGATGTDDEFTQIADYLTKSFPATPIPASTSPAPATPPPASTPPAP